MYPMLRSLLILILIVLLAACNVRKIAQSMYAADIVKAPYDVIIVPGIAYDTTRQVKSGFNARIVWAKRLYDAGIAKNIIFSGNACSTPYKEGEAMRLIAIAMGVPANHVFAENHAEHSKENVYYGWLLAQKLGFKKVALAANPYQAFFLQGFIETNLKDMGILPMAVDSIKKYNQPLPAFNDSAAFVKDFIPLNKRETFWTRVRHTNHNNLPQAPAQ